MKTVTFINGKYLPPSKAKISVFDNALLYAEGLFETLLAIDDRVIYPKAHLDRLFRGAKLTGLKIPVNRTTLNKWMKETVSAHPDHIKKLRITLTSGEAARWTGVQGEPKIIMSTSPHVFHREPFHLQLSHWRIDEASEFRRIKTISYAIHAAALKLAKVNGYDDALMLNEKGEIAEVTSANIFWVKNRKVYTPPLSAGCLEGTTRNLVMKLAEKCCFNVIEKNITLPQIMLADEIFISSSLKLILSVGSINDTKKRHIFFTGPVTEQLAGKLRKSISL